jgi:hypothetical protein
MNPLHAIYLIESGKQVGASLDTTENGICYHNSIGVQRWQDRFRVNISRIAYDDMASDQFEVDEVVEFATLDDALDYLTSHSCVPIEDLDVCKGQKMFSPTHMYSEGGSQPKLKAR